MHPVICSILILIRVHLIIFLTLSIIIVILLRMTGRYSTLTSPILSGATSLTTGPRAVASLSSRFPKIPQIIYFLRISLISLVIPGVFWQYQVISGSFLPLGYSKASILFVSVEVQNTEKFLTGASFKPS